MGNGNGFIPPEAKKAQQPQGSSFVPPEAKKKDFGQPSLGGSEELTESPYTPTNLELEEVKQDYLSVWDDVPQEFQQYSSTTSEFGEQPGNKNLPKFNAFVPKAAVDAMYTASINTPSPNPVMRNYTSNLLREGVKSYNRGVATGLTATNMRQPTPDLGRVAELQKIVQENAPEGSYSDFANSETVGQSLVEFAKDPLGVLTALTTESLASQAGALGGTDLKVVGAGALAGSVIPIAGTVKGAIAGLAFDNSLAIETASYLLQGLQEEGYDISDPESLKQAFTNYELVSRLKEKALAKGLPVAALDALSAGVAGSLGGKTIVRKMLREVPTQMALGGAGEAAGQIAAEGEITEPTAIVAEMLGEIGGSAPEITTGIMASNPELLMRPSSQTLDGRKLLDDTQVEMERDINNAPDWLKPELEAKLNQVIEAKNKLINKDAEFYSGFSDEDKSRVSEINQRLGEIADIFDSSQLSEATKKVYEDEANNLFSEKMDIEGKYIESQTPSTEKVTTQQPKEQADAAEIKKTNEVDVREQTSVGSEVGEEVRSTEEETRGTPEGEVQEEVTTEETIEEPVEGQPKSPTPQKILGETPSKTTKKVTMTDKALVKQRIQDMVKASREGYREGRREIKDLQSKVDEILKTIPKKADFTSAQVRAISKASKNVYTPSQLRRFEQTATKIIDDAEYASKLTEASNAQELIGKRGKSKNYPSNITKFFRDFSKINPKDVPDIDQYLFYANEAKRIIEKPKIKDGQVQETPQISIDEIRNEYINRHAYLSEQDAVASLLEDYQTLSSGENPVIDATMTEDEIRSVIESVYAAEEKEGVTTDLKGLEKLIDYKLMEVEAIPSEGLTSAEKEQLDILKDANIQEMNFTRKELGEIYLYLQNYIKNGQLNNISSVTAKIAAKKNVSDILQYYKDKGLSPRQWIKRWSGLTFGTMAMTQLYEAVGGTQDMGAKIYEGTSTYEYAEKKVEAETQFFDKIKDYSNKFKKVKAVENTSDRADRQIYSFLAQVPSDKYQDALAFVDSSIQYYEDGFAGFESKKTGEVVRELFDTKYRGTSNINQVNISNDNKRIITWFRNLFAEIKDEYFENAEIVHNRTLEEKTEPGTYLPFTSRKKGKSKITEDSLDNPSSLLDQVIIPNRSGATNERKNEFNPKDRFMSFDFERSMFSAYENQLLDIKTSFTIKKIAAFFRLPESIDVFGSNELDRSFFNRTKEYVNNSFNSESLGDLENSVFRVLNYASNLSGRVALGGVDQAFKQSIPVLMNMMVNAGMQNGFQALIDYNDKDARATFRKSPVSRRSFVDQDTRKIYSNIPEAERKSFKGRIMKGFGVTDAMAEKIMMFAIQGSDKYAAQVSWLAYYKQARGENFKGWEQESKNPNRQSSAFADLMINNTQNVNDIDQQASWLKVKQDSSAGRYFSLIRRSSLPFISFTVNQIMDETVQISKVKVAPNEVARRLGGRILEQFAFAAIKKALYAMYGAAALGLLSWLGIEYDDEEDKEGVSDFFAVLAQGTLGSLPFYGVSGYVDAAIGTAVNKAYYNRILSEKERRKYSGLDGRSARGLSEKEIRDKLNRGFEKFMKDKPPVFVPSGDESLDLGMFSIGLDNHTADAAEFLRALEAYSGNEDFEYVTRSGNRIQMPLTEEEERAMVILSILENTDLALPNDIAKIAGKAKREITNRQFDKLYGSKGR